MTDQEASVRLWLDAYAAMMFELLPAATVGRDAVVDRQRSAMLERIIDVRVYLRDTAAQAPGPHAAIRELNTYADHTHSCKVGETGDHDDCNCGYNEAQEACGLASPAQGAAK
jgi:hypothetical protein